MKTLAQIAAALSIHPNTARAWLKDLQVWKPRKLYTPAEITAIKEKLGDFDI
jgi:transposase-like protein